MTVRVIDVRCPAGFAKGTVELRGKRPAGVFGVRYGTSVEDGYLIRMLVGTGPTLIYNATAAARCTTRASGWPSRFRP